MEKLYTVKLAIQYIVLARDEQHALHVAKKESAEAFRNSGYADMHFQIEEGAHAEGWDDRSFPYGDVEDRTVGEYKEEIEHRKSLFAHWEKMYTETLRKEILASLGRSPL